MRYHANYLFSVLKGRAYEKVRHLKFKSVSTEEIFKTLRLEFGDEQEIRRKFKDKHSKISAIPPPRFLKKTENKDIPQ